MSKEIEEKIRRLAEIRTGLDEPVYVNPFRAQEDKRFLLALIDELTEALFKIHAAIQEGRKNDIDIDPCNKRETDPLPS